MEIDQIKTQEIDPDPFTVISALIAAASLVLQFVEIAKANPNKDNFEIKATSREHLIHLEDSVETLETTFKKIERTISRGASNSDIEFYDASFGVCNSALYLDSAAHSTFTSELANFYSQVGAVSRWANTTIKSHPMAVTVIGNSLLHDLEHSAHEINRLIRTGAANREIIAQCRFVITAMRTCLTALLDKKSN